LAVATGVLRVDPVDREDITQFLPTHFADKETEAQRVEEEREVPGLRQA
jgi:hypothetical protein